jgi:hypothetical protein
MFFYAGKAGKITGNEYIVCTKRKVSIGAAKDLVEVKCQLTVWNFLCWLCPAKVSR